MDARSRSDPGERARVGDRAYRAGVVVNTLLAVVKLLGGLLSGSPSLTADGYHSFSDTATNGVAWLSWRWSQRPPDEDHHYGHGKGEALAGAAVGAVLVVAGLALVWKSVFMGAPSYLGPQAPIALGVAGVSIASNLWLAGVTGRAAESLNSAALRALTRDNRSDALSSALVVAGVGASLLGLGGLELLAAGVIGLSIAHMGGKSLREGLDVLMDRVTDLELRHRVRALAGAVPGVAGVQRVDVHPLGGVVRVDMQISVDGDLTVRKGHEIAHEVEEAVTRGEDGVVDVAVHVNPAG